MRPHAAVLMTVLVSACGVDLPLRDDVVYTCDDDDDCPLELSCATGIKQCVRDLDTTPPRLTSITAASRESVILVFDDLVDETRAKLATSYSIVRNDGQTLEVQGAGPIEGGLGVVLRTGLQRGAAVYTLSTTVTDSQGNAAVLDQSRFDGFGAAPDTVAPDAITPTRNSIIVMPPEARAAPQVTLTWSARAGAIDYTVDVSLRADFATLETSVTVPGSEARHTLDVREGLTYFWRVRSDATTDGAYGESAFTVLFDTIYVSCPAATVCRSSDGIGSRNVPLSAISRAVSLSNDRGLGTIAIAGRGDDPVTGTPASYHEPVTLTGGAVALRGGYDHAFAEAPSRSLHPTRIAYEGNVLGAIETTGTITVEKLELLAVLEPTVPAFAQNLSALVVETPSHPVRVIDSLIATADLSLDGPDDSFPNQAIAIAVFSSTDTLYLDSATTVIAGPSRDQSLAVIALGSSVDIDGTEIITRRTVDSDNGSSGVVMLGGDVHLRHARITCASSQSGVVSSIGGMSGVIEDNTIVVDGPGSTCIGASLTGLTGGALRFERNRVHIGSGCNGSIGVMTFGAEPVVVANNTFVSNSSQTSVGVNPRQDSLALIVNNTIVLSGLVVAGVSIETAHPDLANNLFVAPASSNTVCVAEMGTSSDAKALLNNVFLGCDDVFRNEGETTLASIDVVQGEAIDCAGCGTVHASANQALAAADPFVSLAGADGNVETMDYDLRLASNGGIAVSGIDTRLVACGSNESPHGCGSIMTDIAGLPRTVPVSAGAYERD